MAPKDDEIASLKRRIQDLEKFHRLAVSLSSRHTVYDTLTFVAEWCVQITGANHAAVLLFTPVPSESVRTLARNSDALEDGIDHGINVMAAGWVRAKQRPLVTDDVLRELRFNSPSDNQKKFGPLLAVPLYSDAAMIGVLNLCKLAGRPPFDDDDLGLITGTAPLAARSIERARMFESLTLDHARLKASTVRLQDQRWIPSLNPQMQEISDRIARVSPSSATVLLTGETGTGKELVAWAIHLQSPRAEKPFVAVNCGAIPSALADAELFGHERGAFTGAEVEKPGRFELADGGTLFLDEISAMPMDLQPRLLRVLEERQFSRVGSSHPINVDVRVIVATNRDLETEVRQGTFREDLFHRLNVFPLRLPPLRERREDIPVLAAAFLAEFSASKSTFTPDALETLREMSWPGNVRELRNLVERVSILYTPKVITPHDILRATVGNAQDTPRDLKAIIMNLLAGKPAKMNLIEETEKQFIQVALQQADGNVTKAARLLGIGRISLHRRLEKLRISGRP
jgi:transcriptional regulator with GAF, ATPase, and Fis domain